MGRRRRFDGYDVDLSAENGFTRHLAVRKATHSRPQSLDDFMQDDSLCACTVYSHMRYHLYMYNKPDIG